MSNHEPVDQRMIRSLTRVIVTALGGIIGLSLAGLAIRAGLFGAQEGATVQTADEALSVLGQIGSAGVGALAGYFTARIVNEHVEDHHSTEPPPVVTRPVDLEPGPDSDDRDAL